MKIIGHILEYVGTMLVAYSAIAVHHRVLNEHKIDKRVYRAMKIEQILAILGGICITAGFVMQIFAV